MHACIHKVQWIHRRQGDEIPKKIGILPDNGNVGLHVYAKSHDHTYAVLYAHSSVSSHCLRLVAIIFRRIPVDQHVHYMHSPILALKIAVEMTSSVSIYPQDPAKTSVLSTARSQYTPQTAALRIEARGIRTQRNVRGKERRRHSGRRADHLAHKRGRRKLAKARRHGTTSPMPPKLSTRHASIVLCLSPDGGAVLGGRKRGKQERGMWR